jgi:hypothetical protein
MCAALHDVQRYEELHDRYSGHVRDLTYRMRGFYLKNAQYLSVRDDFIPVGAPLHVYIKSPLTCIATTLRVSPRRCTPAPCGVLASV